MQKKGKITKEMILNSASGLFSKQGYSKISMQDICAETGLSRGGLYRYFGSTKEIFLELLNRNKNNASDELQKAINENVSADSLFNYFLNSCKESIFAEDSGFFFAIHEFAFIETEMKGFMQTRFNEAVEMLTSILILGQNTSQFNIDFEPKLMAEHFLFTIDSFQLSSSILEISEDKIIKQFELLKRMVYKNDTKISGI